MCHKYNIKKSKIFTSKRIFITNILGIGKLVHAIIKRVDIRSINNINNCH
ncbi:hypothetical protein HanHA300_Chr03g0081881 [Helianthus annuus]|nr:hypothetical protein HanHA300_Chr03g0081881 [Helianthus annuus]